MSGPKVSDYELEQRRKEALRKQYMEEQRRKQAHLRQQNAFRGELRQRAEQLQRLISEVEQKVNEIKDDARSARVVSAFRSLRREAEGCLHRCKAVRDNSEIAVQAFQECQNALARTTEQLLMQNSEVMDERMAQQSSDFMDSLRAIRGVSASGARVQRAKEADAQDVERARLAVEAYNASCARLASALAAMPEKKSEIERMQAKLNFEAKAVCRTAGESQRVMTICQREIKHTVDVWTEERERRIAETAKRDELARQYCYYCDELNVPRMSAEELKAKSESELESICATLDNRLYRYYEEDYVYQCIHEAMKDMGYKLYGRANNGVQGQFLYRMHGDTAVHVSCADNGVISMEVVMASSERHELEAREVDGLVEDMKTFCGDYLAVQRALSGKGLACKRNIVMLPPEPAYAMTMDTSQYALDEQHVQYEPERERVERYIDSEA